MVEDTADVQAAQAFDTGLTALGVFPSPRRARVLWAGLEDPQEREGLAWSALSAAKGRYAWETVAHETLALYRDLVA